MVLLLFVIWVWWELPKWRSRLALDIMDQKARARRMTKVSTAIKDKLVSERLYDRETCDVMTDAEAEKLWRLHQEIGQAFDDACDEYAAIHGLEKSQLSDKQRANIIDKVEALMENYDMADSDVRNPKESAPSTRLTACVMRHHHLSLEISNIRDDISSRFDVGDL
jgi:hypothetical protein